MATVTKKKPAAKAVAKKPINQVKKPDVKVVSKPSVPTNRSLLTQMGQALLANAAG